MGERAFGQAVIVGYELAHCLFGTCSSSARVPLRSRVAGSPPGDDFFIIFIFYLLSSPGIHGTSLLRDTSQFLPLQVLHYAALTVPYSAIPNASQSYSQLACAFDATPCLTFHTHMFLHAHTFG